MLSLFSVKKYFSLSLSLFVWLLASVGLCFSANVVANSKCIHINMVSKPYLSKGGKCEAKCEFYSFYSLLINIFLPEYIGIQFLSDMVW